MYANCRVQCLVPSTHMKFNKYNYCDDDDDYDDDNYIIFFVLIPIPFVNFTRSLHNLKWKHSLRTDFMPGIMLNVRHMKSNKTSCLLQR